MRGQLKAQQHTLLGLQEQLQGAAYPALEAAAEAAAASSSSANQLPAPHASELTPHSLMHSPHEIAHRPVLSSGTTLHECHHESHQVANPDATGVERVTSNHAQQPDAGAMAMGTRQATGAVRPASARQADALRSSHEGLAVLVSQIGQHVGEADPEQEARKRPRRAISAEGAKENRHK